MEEKVFNSQRTRIFFEGLLPEGFTRRYVAEWMHVDENDYISILAGLGKVCLGEITRDSFEKAASQIGLGTKMAMKRFDTMVTGFASAMNRAKEELKAQGFEQVEQICEKIMQKGGISKV